MSSDAPSGLSALQPRPGSARIETVVFAITEFEEHQFFPAGLRETFHQPLRIERPDGQSPEDWARRLTELDPPVLVSSWRTPPLQAFAGAKSCPVKYVCHLAGSVRRLVPRELLVNGLVVTNWGTLPSAIVAEHALLLTLGALRNLGAWPEALRIRNRVQLETRLGTRTLFGRRIGLHGFGAVARSLVALLKPFGVALTAYSGGVPPHLMTELGVTPAASLETLFAEAEILIECEALTPATRGSVSAEILHRLPEGAVVVNVGRGAVVDDAALLAMAAAGRIRVALDVMAAEPPAPDSGWWQVRDTVFSPHIGGPTKDRYHDLGAFALANLRRYFAGEPLEAVITPEIYDRST